MCALGAQARVTPRLSPHCLVPNESVNLGYPEGTDDLQCLYFHTAFVSAQ